MICYRASSYAHCCLQVLLVGVSTSAPKPEVLVLHQGDGQAAAPPIPLTSDGQVSRIIVHEDGIALATVKVLHGTEHTAMVPVRIHISEAQDLGKEGQLARKHLHTLSTYTCCATLIFCMLYSPAQCECHKQDDCLLYLIYPRQSPCKCLSMCWGRRGNSAFRLKS